MGKIDLTELDPSILKDNIYHIVHKGEIQDELYHPNETVVITRAQALALSPGEVSTHIKYVKNEDRVVAEYQDLIQWVRDHPVEIKD
jgi:hypothetical protein